GHSDGRTLELGQDTGGPGRDAGAGEVHAVRAMMAARERARVDPAHVEVGEQLALQLRVLLVPCAGEGGARAGARIGRGWAEPHDLPRAGRARLAHDPREVLGVPLARGDAVVAAERDDDDLRAAAALEQRAQIAGLAV